MNIEDAQLLLKCHAFTHDRIEHWKMENGFLGSLRPFRGELLEGNLHEVMAALRALSDELGRDQVNRELISSLWGLYHLARAWALEPEGMLRSNGLLSKAQIEMMETWLNLISYAVMILLENGGEEEAFHGYREYVRSRVLPLKEELETLLPCKIQDEEILGLYDQFRDHGGVAPSRLDEFEKKFGILLPEDFRAFYEQKDGSGYAFHILYPGEDAEEAAPFYLMSLAEMEDVKRYFCERDELLEEYYSPEEIAKLDRELRPYLFHRQWYPFASMAGGSLYLMLDLDPGDEGTYGQIISYIHDPDFVYYTADSFTSLLRESNRNLAQLEEIEY
jgi:internalin A